MKFDKKRPVKIVMLGCGGTGGHIATHLYRLLHALERAARFIICDGDKCEEKNLIRQNFAPADLGLNKAQVLSERYANVFGLECEYIPDFVEEDKVLLDLLKPREWCVYNPQKGNTTIQREIVILIGAVDNNKSRQMCHRVFKKSKNLIYIDSGNGERTGQVVCGIRRNGKQTYAPVGDLCPDVLEDKDKFPSELSCEDAAISAPQSIMANVMAATAVLCIIYNILAEGSNTVEHITFSSRLCSMKPELQSRRENRAANILELQPAAVEEIQTNKERAA